MVKWAYIPANFYGRSDYPARYYIQDKYYDGGPLSILRLKPKKFVIVDDPSGEFRVTEGIAFESLGGPFRTLTAAKAACVIITTARGES